MRHDGVRNTVIGCVEPQLRGPGNPMGSSGRTALRAAARLPDHFDPEPCKRRVIGDDRYVFDQRLRGQHAIEGVLVRSRQPASQSTMLDRDRERLEVAPPVAAISRIRQAIGDAFRPKLRAAPISAGPARLPRGALTSRKLKSGTHKRTARAAGYAEAGNVIWPPGPRENVDERPCDADSGRR